MLLRITFLLSLIILTTSIAGQSIESLRSHGRKPYAVNGKKASHAQILRLLVEVTETKPVVKKAKQQQLVSIPFALVGSGLIGYQLGSWGAGRDEGNNSLPAVLRLGVGTTFIVMATVFEGKANRSFAEAVGIYNRAIVPNNGTAELSIGPGAYGYGLVINF